MNTFLKKIFYLLLIYFILSRFVTVIVPYHWGNPWYSTKIQYLMTREKHALPNTYFFGSSRVYRQVSPQVFDDSVRAIRTTKVPTLLLNDSKSGDVVSFNLGAPATFCPQTYYLYEQFLDSELSEAAQYIFIELLEIRPIDEHLMHQERTTYWQNLSYLNLVFRSFIENASLERNQLFQYMRHYIVAYIENLFHLGHFGEQLIDRNYYDKVYLGQNRNGFFPLEDELRGTTKQRVRDNFIKRNQLLANNPSVLNTMALNSIDFYNSPSEQVDRVHLQKVMRLLHMAEVRDIHLVFILSPRSTTPNLVGLFEAIPQQNRIDLSNAEAYPSLYQLENSFDTGHLNNQGAVIYSELFAREFFKIAELNGVHSASDAGNLSQ
ncbi:MAG: hypothetical protein AAF702_45945 [Chloroflexota bacterium]